nr:copia protein [Tanacetum cinerariifolium]
SNRFKHDLPFKPRRGNDPGKLVYPDDFLEIESDATFDNDSFDSEGEKIKEAELLIDPLDFPCDIMSEYDFFNSQDFSRDDVLFSPDNEDKVFNPGILSHDKSVKIITHVTQEKKLTVSFASWLFEDFDPPFFELLVFKEVPISVRLLPFSSENEEKVFKPGIYTFKKFHCCFLSDLSHLVIPEIHDSNGCTFLSEELPYIDSFNDIHPYFDDDPLSGSTTYSTNSLLEEFADELALISYPPDYDDNRVCDIESDIREIEFLLYQDEDSDFKDSIDQSVLTNFDDLFVDPTPEMFTDEQPPDYSFPPRFDVYPDDFLEIESDANTVDDDFFDSEGEKIKEADLLRMMFCSLLIMRTRNKKDKHGITTKNKARLVAQGYSEEEGIDYDETFTLVARMEAIKIFLAFATCMNFKVYQMDVKSAFLNGTYGMATDYGIMKEEMSKLSGRKSVPGMNSRKRGSGKKRLLGLHDNIAVLDGMSILSGSKSVPGMYSRKRGKWKEKTTRSSRELH